MRAVERTGIYGLVMPNVYLSSGVGIESVTQTAKSSESGGVNTVTFTMSNGETVDVDVRNGEQGIQGEKGEQGEQGIQGEKGDDGFSPSASVKQLSDGAKISITDKDGTTEATVKNVVRELVPSVSHYQTGTLTPSLPAGAWTTAEVTLAEPMPDDDYCVTFDCGDTAYVHVQEPFQKRRAGFKIIIYSRDSTIATIRWQAFKLITDTTYTAMQSAVDEALPPISALDATSAKAVNSTAVQSAIDAILPITSGTATRNTATTASQTVVSWQKFGRMVMVLCTPLVVNGQYTSGTVLATGLPKPKQQTRFTLGTADTTDTACSLFQVNSSGQLIADGAGSIHTGYWTTFCYLSAE